MAAATGIVHTDRRPTARQIYAITHALVEVAGLEFPTDRKAASDLLVQVREQRDAIKARMSADDAPF